MTLRADPGNAVFKEIDQARPRLADHVYQQIRGAILAGQIPPSQRIVQDEVAARIKVSRTPVREALFRLEKEGILRKSAGQGFYARELSLEEVRQIFQAREALEGFAAGLVAAERTPEKVAAIATAVEAERGVDRDDFVAVFDCNRAIHRTVVEQTGNAFLVDGFDSVWNQAVSLSLFALAHARRPVESGDHDALFAALRDGTPGEARRTMLDHIATGLENQLAAVRAGAAGQEHRHQPTGRTDP